MDDGEKKSPFDFRRSTFKAVIDKDDAKKKRETVINAVRRQKKEDRWQKFRSTSSGGHEAGVGALNSPGQGATLMEALQPTKNLDPTVAAKLELIPQMLAMVFSNNPAEQLEGTSQFRKLLSIERHPPITEVIRSGVVPVFVQYLQRSDFPKLQFEAAWALTNIASGTSAHTQVVIENRAVPIFVQLLSSPVDDVREQAVWAIGNIAGDSPQCRDMVLKAGALHPLLHQLMQNNKLSMLRNSTWTLSNFCRGKPQPPFDLVRDALGTLSHLIYSNDEEILTDACWALSYMSDGNNDKIQAVLEAGVTRRLVELLMHPSPAVQTPALRTIGNIVTGDDLQTQIVLNAGALPCLLTLMSSHKKSIRKETCWTISNITAGNKDQIQYVIEANLIPPLIRMLEVAEFDIRKEAAWALSNATSGGTPVQIRYMVSRGAVAALCGLLGVQDAKIISVALEGLENILRVGEMEREMVRGPINECARMIEECGGAEKLDALENHENHDVYERTNRIQQTYFGGDETTLEGPAPGTATVATVPFAFGVVPPTAPQPGAPAANPFNGAANPFANLAANMPTYR